MVERILAEFSTINRSEDAAVSFAMRWGVLGLCRHGLPATHAQGRRRTPTLIQTLKVCSPTKRGDWWYERLDRWLFYSRLFEAILACGAAIERGHDEVPVSDREVFGVEPDFSAGPNIDRAIVRNLPGEERHWQVIYEFLCEGGYRGLSVLQMGRLLASRTIVSLAVEKLIGVSQIKPIFTWRNKRPDFYLHGRSDVFGLFGTLVVQLMLTVSLAKRWAVCRGDECGRPFMVRKETDVQYCEDCRPKILHRRAVNRYVEQERENPERAKRRQLTAAERETVLSSDKSAPELERELGVSRWAIYKVRKRSKRA